jgi:glucose-1-phosphate thymidylyltransferase
LPASRSFKRLVDDLAAMHGEAVEEVAYVIGPSFGPKVEKQLKDIAKDIGANRHHPLSGRGLGTAHAILCAGDALEGHIIVAFADTFSRATDEAGPRLRRGDLGEQGERPRAFGVVKLDAQGIITELVEKPQEFVSDLAIIGIYYFRDGEHLRRRCSI